MRVLLVIAMSVVLIGCSSAPAANVVVDRPPLKTCSLDGFSCVASAGGPGVVAFTLRNNAAYEMLDVTVAADSDDCKFKRESVTLGRLPANVATPVRFECESTAPQDMEGKLTLTFVTRKDTATQERHGRFTFLSSR